MNQELIVCHKCLHQNCDTRDFCERCGAPIGTFTTISPLERIQAEGHAYREASSNPTKPIVLIGVWLLFAPGAALLFYALFKIITKKAWSEDIAWFLCYGAISIALLSKTTINFIKNKKKAEPAI
ncbi:MAG: hypothetical protein HKP10_04855 [Kiritimatiellales bacterium]|nr:hypothetical protein [Pontiella sp.]NNJ70602.1 hypothetical protein [Kiritimatiellales bacterium]